LFPSAQGLEGNKISLKAKPTLNKVKDGKKIAMKKKIIVGEPTIIKYTFLF